jgi:hypothetical protein
MKFGLLTFFKSGNSNLWIWDHYLHVIKGTGMRIFPAKRCVLFLIRM